MDQGLRGRCKIQDNVINILLGQEGTKILSNSNGINCNHARGSTEDRCSSVIAIEIFKKCHDMPSIDHVGMEGLGIDVSAIPSVKTMG